jgi:hypothetical protein
MDLPLLLRSRIDHHGPLDRIELALAPAADLGRAANMARARPALAAGGAGRLAVSGTDDNSVE